MKRLPQHEYVRAADAFDPSATYLAWRPAPDDWQRPHVGDTTPLPVLPRAAPIERRTRAPVGPDAVDWAVAIVGGLFFVCVVMAGCALLFVVARVMSGG